MILVVDPDIRSDCNCKTRRAFRFAAFLFVSVSIVPHAYPEGTLSEIRGRTMGTTYMVKWFEEDASEATIARMDVQIAVEKCLRQVNDQMSTYLRSSEISRFNASPSTDWFSISPAFAGVVKEALEVSRLTDGAFDVTVGPLVNRWNFGPSDPGDSLPDESEVKELLSRVGYGHLEVRLEPASIRKAIPQLKLDLSAIAKGHGVDAVVATLTEQGIANAFVEIGGEVAVTGDKGGSPWMVGIQQPDRQAGQALLAAHPISDSAMATSGDYRNFYDFEGVRYSHTIDPRSGSPVNHTLASATVITKTCMMADAWATALMVLGAEEGLRLAKQQELSVLLVSRRPDEASPLAFALSGTGDLETYATEARNMETITSESGASWIQQMLPVMAITAFAMMAVVMAMAVGVIFGRRSISGSCGGLNSTTDEDGTSRCSLCSNPSDACKELRERLPEKRDATEITSV
ncbi:MAG: FAD:protein FMN transferase [Planctomycetota bacterium]